MLICINLALVMRRPMFDGKIVKKNEHFGGYAVKMILQGLPIVNFELIKS